MIDIELEKFLKYLMESKRLPAAKTYRSVLVPFISWLGERNKTLATFTTPDADTFFRNIENRNTANMFIAALKGFMAYRYQSLPPDDPHVPVEMQRYMQLQMIKARPYRQKREKVALTPDEVGELFDAIKKRKTHDVLIAGTVVCFLWGARAQEQEYFMRSSGVPHAAKYDWKNNSVILWTSKVHHPRFLCWNEIFTPYVKTWVKSLPTLDEPGKWLTQRLRRFEVGGLRITSKVGRKSFQTNFRMEGVEEWIINSVLGHTDKNSPVSDAYGDYTIYESKIRDALVNKHYLITHGII